MGSDKVLKLNKLAIDQDLLIWRLTSQLLDIEKRISQSLNATDKLKAAHGTKNQE